MTDRSSHYIKPHRATRAPAFALLGFSFFFAGAGWLRYGIMQNDGIFFMLNAIFSLMLYKIVRN